MQPHEIGMREMEADSRLQVFEFLAEAIGYATSLGNRRHSGSNSSSIADAYRYVETCQKTGIVSINVVPVGHSSEKHWDT